MRHDSVMGRSSHDSDTTDGDDDGGMDDEMVDKISSSPSIDDDEDINFEFVYALHTFVATVEGQANAQKGDAMQLLDDSNSYWWLVRVCKDSSIGYLPAEHIETPRERLARLNKHRNRDLAREHLGDAEVKKMGKNPFSIKRRTKMVQFTVPTYYEASEAEFSETDEQDLEEDENDISAEGGMHAGQESGQIVVHDRIAAASSPPDNSVAAAVQNAAPSPTAAIAEVNQLNDPERPSDTSLDRSDSLLKTTRNGNIRNTDSFFKDETAEPKKVSLTPSLLRDVDEGGASSRSSESNRDFISPISESFEGIDRTSPTSDKFKDDRKKKKEKSGMLSGLFKRKEKKIKVDEAAGGTVRTSQSDMEGLLASPTATSPGESSVTSPTREQSLQTSRRPSSNGKLVKSPPASVTPQGSTIAPSNPSAGQNTSQSWSSKANPSQSSGNTTLPPPGSAQRGDIGEAPVQAARQPLRIQTQSNPSITQSSTATSTPERDNFQKTSKVFSPLSSLGRDPNEPKKERLKKAEQRMELDVDSSPESEVVQHNHIRNAAHTPPPRVAPAPPEQEPFKKQSISPVDPPLQPSRYPPILEPSKSAQSNSPVSPSTPTESTSTVYTPETASEEPKSSNGATSTTPDSKGHIRSESEDPQWNDEALYQYLENQSSTDVRELLLYVHDKNDVKPVSKDHPIMKELNFEQHEKKLDEMSNQLDGLLHDFLARKAAKRKVSVKR